MKKIMMKLKNNNFIYLKIDDELFIFVDDVDVEKLIELIDPEIQQLKKIDDEIENKIYVLRNDLNENKI